MATAPIRVGAFELDPRSRELRDGTTRIRLQGQPPNGTFVDFEHSLNAAIKRLRVALGDDAERPTFVETVPRCGYRYIGAAS